MPIRIFHSAIVTLSSGSLNSGSGNLLLTGTAGAVQETGAGTISGNLLTTHSVTGTILANANDVSSFNATNTTSGNVQLTDTAAPVSITGISETGGNVIVTDTNGVSVAASDNITSSGNIAANAGSGTLTLNAGSELLSSNLINLTADTMNFNTSGTPAQIGGTGTGTGSAANVILQPSTAARTISIAGGAGNLQLSAAALGDVLASNVHIGNSSAGNINVGAWTPGAGFAASGVLTLDTAGTITQSGAINLATDGAGLLLRDASAVTLTTSNVFATIAANIAGSLTISNAATDPLTVGSLTDDVGTVNGIIAPTGVTLTASGSGGSLTINQSINSSGSNGAVALNGHGITEANAANVNSGSGTININAGGAAAQFNSGTLTTTNSGDLSALGNCGCKHGGSG